MVIEKVGGSGHTASHYLLTGGSPLARRRQRPNQPLDSDMLAYHEDLSVLTAILLRNFNDLVIAAVKSGAEISSERYSRRTGHTRWKVGSGDQR
jgi:hypothetical protein